jgi:hypothetical protein
MIKDLKPFLAVALITFGAPLGAQNATTATPPPPPNTGLGQIIGVVVDSLNGRYLAGADILFKAGTPAVTTDSVGRFKIDSLPPGMYQVGVFHDMLDTLGTTLLTKPFHVGSDSAVVVLLAIPSAATLVRRSCPVQSETGASAVIGHVADPETLQPVAKAEVSVAWTDFEISKALGLQRTPRLVRDTTDASGAFKICGLPSSLDATLKAQRGSASTAEIPISLGARPSELLARTVLLSSADSAAKTGKASVSGKVLLEGGPTSGGTRVELAGTDIVALTNAQGEFTMSGLPSGSKLLVARHLGFTAQAVVVDLSSRQEKHVTMSLTKFVAVMDPVLVTARRSAALDKVGFTQRSKSGFGYYLSPERLQNMHPNVVTDILRQVPGLRVISGPRGETVSSSRAVGNGCVRYYLDGMSFLEVEPGEINHFLTGSEIVAVEVYQDANTPAEYMRGGGSCTTIVLWTRFKIRG